MPEKKSAIYFIYQLRPTGKVAGTEMTDDFDDFFLKCNFINF